MSMFDTPYFEPDIDNVNVLRHSVVKISQAIIDKAVEVSCESQGVQEGDKNNIYFHQHTIIAVPTISSPSSLRKCIPIDYNMCSIAFLYVTCYILMRFTMRALIKFHIRHIIS